MNEKFKANLWIALPAAIVTLAIYIIIGAQVSNQAPGDDINFWLIVPYFVIILLAVGGINVTVVLVAGILSAVVIALFSGFSPLDLAGFAGDGVQSMGELIIIALLAAGMLGIIKECGGITYLLQVLTRHIKGSRGAQAVISILVALVNVCTANNTVAIITVGTLSREIAERFGIEPRKAASLLDSASCIVQCLIPYGAQALLAASFAQLSPSAMMPYLYYPWALAFMLIISIAVKRKKIQ
jgi:Na+/H+ antiporter NhaC